MESSPKRPNVFVGFFVVLTSILAGCSETPTLLNDTQERTDKIPSYAGESTLVFDSTTTRNIAEIGGYLFFAGESKDSNEICVQVLDNKDAVVAGCSQSGEIKVISPRVSFEFSLNSVGDPGPGYQSYSSHLNVKIPQGGRN